MNDTLEKGAHHQTIDLSEELPSISHHHQHHHPNLQHTNSLASTLPAGTAVGGSAVVVPPPYSPEAGGSEAPLELRGSLDCWACSVLVTAQNLLIAAINACLAGLVFGLILTPAIVMVVFGFLCHSTVRATEHASFQQTFLSSVSVLSVHTSETHSFRDPSFLLRPPQECIPVLILHTTQLHTNQMFLSLSFQVRPHGSIPYCSDLLTDGGCVALLVVGFLLVTPLLVLALAAYCRLARHLQLGLCFIPYSRAVYKNLPATQHRGLAGGCCGQRSGSTSCSFSPKITTPASANSGTPYYDATNLRTCIL